MTTPGEAPAFETAPFLAKVRFAALAMAVSLTLAALVSWLALPSALVLPAAAAETVTWPLLGVALILILLSSRLRSRALKHGIAVSRFHPERAPAVLAAAYRRATLVSLGLLEAAGLLGFVLSLLTGSPRFGVLFGLLGALAMLTRWPRRGELRRLLDGRLRP